MSPFCGVKSENTLKVSCGLPICWENVGQLGQFFPIPLAFDGHNATY
jgi:hypothetical protein